MRVEENRADSVNAAYATRSDFCRVFEKDMKPLYLLAFLLTGNHADAERCFTSALGEAHDESLVFKEFAGSWSRRAIIRNAIEIVSPAKTTDNKREPWNAEQGSIVSATIDAVTEVTPLQRCIYVMSVLEKYSVAECAALLSCTRQEVVSARTLALEKFGADDNNLSSLAATAASAHAPLVA